MGVLAMLELEGDTERLRGATGELDRLLGASEGLLVRITAPTDDGVVLFQLWESAEARRRHHETPGHEGALEASGLWALVRGSRSRAFDGAVLHPLGRHEEERA